MGTYETAKRYVVYAPVGLATMLREMGPGMVQFLAEKGRQELEKHPIGSPFQRVGEYANLALSVARPEVERRLGIARHPAPEAGHDAPVHDSMEAPFPNYDALTSSQVISKLSGADDTLLLNARAYESAHRARVTILRHIDSAVTH